MIPLSETLFSILIAAVALERLVELRVAKRNAVWTLGRGGREYGRSHYPFMVALHVLLLVGCVLEVWLAERPFVPALGGPMLMLVLAAQLVRWHVIGTLGPYWNTRIIVVPGMPRIDRGLFRYLSHPNYVAVVVEGLALPLVHGAWITAVSFTLLNALLLAVRIRVEERALLEASGEPEPPAKARRRFTLRSAGRGLTAGGPS